MVPRTVGYMDLFELVFLFNFRYSLRVELLYHMVVFICRQIAVALRIVALGSLPRIEPWLS